LPTLASFSPRLYYAVGITIFLVVLWSVTPIIHWFHAFVKLKPMRAPYTVIFFVLLFLLLYWLWDTVGKRSFVAIVVIGALLGQSLAFLSIFIANLFIPNGIERTIKTISQQGILNVLFTDFFVAFILGGWLIGAVALVALKLTARRAD